MTFCSFATGLLGQTALGAKNSQVNSSLESALDDDDHETMKMISNDRHCHAGRVLPGALRGDSELVFCLDRVGKRQPFFL